MGYVVSHGGKHAGRIPAETAAGGAERADGRGIVSGIVPLTDDALALLRANRRTTDGHTYTVPSPGRYPYQWLWDSCFHAIVLARYEPESAIEEIRSLVARQFPDGMIPHIIFWEPRITRPYYIGWGGRGTSTITQTPLLAYAVWEIYRRTGDRAVLAEFHDALMRFYRFFVERRDPERRHLAGIVNPDESGEDDSPRFDLPMGVPAGISFLGHLLKRHGLMRENRARDFDPARMREVFWVEDVLVNTVLVRNLELLARISGELDKREDERFATLHAGLVKAAVRERLFDREAGVYWSADARGDGVPLKTATWAHFVPLFAGLYSKDEARRVIEMHFRDPERFHAPFGLRTTSKREAAYRPDGFWRGPVWFAPHWFVYKGLLAYGFSDEAAWLADRSRELIARNGFREYFNPETGEAYGARDFTWGALALDMEPYAA